VLSIQTNVNSLIAQQNLNINNEFQSQTIQQLTSGYRINSSGDDAAGLAVANKYRSSVAELSQGVANGNDGSAQLQIMDGGMSNISQILDRLKTLATQSASGTFTGVRSTVNAEFQNDLSEIDRQAQSIGLNTGGTFNKNLDVYLGQGSGSQTLKNGVVTLDLSGSAVDSQALGLMGMEAVNVTGSLNGTNTGTDIGSTSTTSVQNIVSNTSGVNANQEATAGYAAITFSGAGFSDAGAIPISVNLSGVTDTSTLVTAVNNAIQAAGSGSTAAATAFKNSNIVASVHTDSNGGQELAFTSSTAAFQVQAGDQMGNALLGNVSVVGGVAKGTPVSATAATTVTGANTSAGTGFTQNQVVKLVVNGGGLASPVTLQVSTGAGAVTTSAAITDLENQFSSNAALQAAGLSMSGSPTPGTALSFNSATGEGFNIQMTGDTSNLLGLGSFLADSTGNADYSTITAGSAYSASAVTGNGTTTGLAAGLEVSINGQASTALTPVDLTAGASATAASASSSAAVGTGSVDITTANQNLSITVTNNGATTTKAFALSTNQVATAGAEVSTVTQTNIVGSPVTIAATSHNNQFTLAINGGTAATLTVGDGTYSTAAAFLTAVQGAITNSSVTGQVTAGWDATTGALTFTSATTGATSSVAVGTATYATAATSWSDTTSANIITSPITVTAGTNDKINVAIDGGASVTLTVGPGTYSTAAAFLTAIQGAISGSSLTGEVTAAYDTANGNKLTLTSASTGAASSITVSATTGNTGFGNLGWTSSVTTHGTAATNNTGVTNIGLTSGATNSGVNDAASTLQSIASQIQTQLGAAAVVTVTNGNLLSIASATKGANSSVTINAPATHSANASLNLTTPAIVTGANSSIADIVSNLNAQFAANGTYQAAGLKAAATASNGLGNGNYITISSNNGTQFRLNALGGGGVATSGAEASTVTQTNIVTSPITVTTGSNDEFKVAVDGGAATTVTVAQGTYSTASAFLSAIQTAIGGVTGLSAGWNASTGALTLTSGTTGNNSSVALTAVNANTGLTALGFSVASNSGKQVTAAENAGFGTSGASFTAAALALVSANASSSGTSMSAMAANGTSNSTPFTFSALKYGSDKQALTFSATDTNGVLEAKTITLQNNTAEGGNTAGASIDAAVAYINQQLQQSTSDPALQSIVAVKENVSGAEQINFVSSLNNFTVGVGSTANNDGLNGGAATQKASTANGSASTMSVDTQANAEAAITAITNAVAQLGSAQAAVGKGENQLNYATNLAQSQITNFSAAESQIRDANVAAEAANLSKAQVLQQSTIAAMAQANSAPQAVLKLLQG
jgi:flagellin